MGHLEFLLCLFKELSLAQALRKSYLARGKFPLEEGILIRPKLVEVACNKAYEVIGRCHRQKQSSLIERFFSLGGNLCYIGIEGRPAIISPIAKIAVPIMVNHTLLKTKVSTTPRVAITVPRIMALTCFIRIII